MEEVDEIWCGLERRLATREDNVTSGETSYKVDNFFWREFYGRFVERVAEGTVKVASGKPDKDGRCASMEAFTLKGIEYLVESHYLIYLIGGDVAGAFLYIHAVAMRNLLLAPAGEILGCGVVGEYVVEDFMIEDIADALLDKSEVDNHAVVVELFGAAVDGDGPVVAVKGGTLAWVVEVEAMCARYFYGFLKVIHSN